MTVTKFIYFRPFEFFYTLRYSRVSTFRTLNKITHSGPFENVHVMDNSNFPLVDVVVVIFRGL